MKFIQVLKAAVDKSQGYSMFSDVLPELENLCTEIGDMLDVEKFFEYEEDQVALTLKSDAILALSEGFEFNRTVINAYRSHHQPFNMKTGEDGALYDVTGVVGGILPKFAFDFAP